jgi:hypothetical protein
MRRIKSFGVIRTSAMVGAVYLVFALPFALIGAAVALGVKGNHPPGVVPPLVFMLSMPLFFGAGGFVMTAILCWFYNIAAKFIGGIAIELTEPN